AGSAAAPAARCRNLRRGSFTLNLPSHHSITSSARASTVAGAHFNCASACPPVAKRRASTFDQLIAFRLVLVLMEASESVRYEIGHFPYGIAVRCAPRARSGR